jgi:hypothetical protein
MNEMEFVWEDDMHDRAEDTEDETFTFLRWQFNVTKFKRLYEGKPARFSVLSFRARDLAGQNAFIGIDRAHIKSMDPKAYLNPLYAVEWNHGLLVIDGHHRIEQAMSIDPDLWMSVILMPERLVPKVSRLCN